MEGLKAPRRARFGLRAKLALVTLVLLALPWAGILYVNEMERLLLHGQEQALLGTARAVATFWMALVTLVSPVPERVMAARFAAPVIPESVSAMSVRLTLTLCPPFSVVETASELPPKIAT